MSCTKNNELIYHLKNTDDYENLDDAIIKRLKLRFKNPPVIENQFRNINNEAYIVEGKSNVNSMPFRFYYGLPNLQTEIISLVDSNKNILINAQQSLDNYLNITVYENFDTENIDDLISVTIKRENQTYWDFLKWLSNEKGTLILQNENIWLSKYWEQNISCYLKIDNRYLIPTAINIDILVSKLEKSEHKIININKLT